MYYCEKQPPITVGVLVVGIIRWSLIIAAFCIGGWPLGVLAIIISMFI